jgi:polysaccharide biosynthesis protein PslA
MISQYWVVKIAEKCGWLNFIDQSVIGRYLIIKPVRNASMSGKIIKWITDKLVVLAVGALAFPLSIFIAIAIKIDSRGPVLFRQKRLGANNKPFIMFKFRTMYVDERDPLGLEQSKVDKRVTRVGRFLRETSMDELPQLINVLRGDMSLVGPRAKPIGIGSPAFDNFQEQYSRHARPGMTGWAQVNGLRGDINTLEKAQAQVSYDMYYIENWSLTLDFVILMRALNTLLISDNTKQSTS